ncbi:ATP-binding protein [Treponema sp. OMZ 305]|uniref:ATP-binding protein n=1 Tax=Treponema TaxID=157 RepID=UPI001BAEE798|nr:MULTISPECIES: ATP-binding protein [Treponema]QUY17186.1 ATP-binding protein [Treponema vincentii]UTC57025.1 ATP-binding protein [Treponema sp. OMZ 305]
MSYISRSLEKIVLEVTKEYPVVLVTGPRQVGKTTMLQKLMEGTDRGYVSLDDLHERALAKTDPELFLQLHKPPILIDEVQYAPELFTYIKIYADKKRSKGDFWLTGSQAFKLMQGMQESLAGRVAVLSLTSLSQAEIYGNRLEPFVLDMKKLSARSRERKPANIKEIFNRIYNGSMPAVISGQNKNTHIFYSSYVTTYIERDVRALSDSIDSLKFLRFITAVAARCGQLLNIADIARDADINQKQVKGWLGILETLGIIFYLHPYSNNMLKRLVKTPKLYFYDTGLVCYLTKWSSAETLESGAMNGAILENYVVSEIMKTYLNNGKAPFMYYYRDKDAKEIDIVLEHDGVLNPIEIKKSANPGSELVKVFSLLDNASIPRSKGAVICMKPELSAIDRENYIVPVWVI